MPETTTSTDITSKLKELFEKNKNMLVGTFGFNETKFNQICNNLNSLKNFFLRNQLIQNISLAIGDLVRNYDKKNGYIDIHNNTYLNNLHTLLDDTGNKLLKLLKLNKIISILKKHNISKIDIILSDVMPQDLTDSYLSSLSALWEKINVIERFIKNYPTNDSSYTYSIELLLLIKKFDHVDYGILKDSAELRNALAFIYQHQEQITFNADLFEKLKENSNVIKQLDIMYSCDDPFDAEKANNILSDLLKKVSNSPAGSARKTQTSTPTTSSQKTPISPRSSQDDEIGSSASQAALPASANDGKSDNSMSSCPLEPSILKRAEESISSYEDSKLGAHSSKIALAAGLGLMAAGAVLAVFSAFALAGTGGLSSVLSAAGLFASYKMIMTGILLAVGTETFFLGEKAMLNNCACASFFGKKPAPAAAAVDALTMI